MSDHWICLIPEDPWHMPDPARRARARARFAEIAPDSDEIRLVASDEVRFFDCGSNFERIRCPSCGHDIAMVWWQERMSDDDSNGFRLASYSTACCGAKHTLNEFEYEWPSGFARFALEALNPNLGSLADGHRADFEAILGTRLRVIYRHY